MIESTLEPLFHVTSLPKHWTIADVNSNFVITNANLEIESFSLYESICDADRLDFGRCNSARVTFTCINIDLNLINKTFDISFTFEGHPNEPFSVGRFTVIEDKPSPDRKSRDVVLQDALYFILNTNYASWYNAITDNQWSSMTLGGFIDSFLTHVGLTADSTSRADLVNASMPVEKTLVTNELLGSTILYAVCQIAGCFGVINREGKFKFLYLKADIEGLYPANDLYPADDLYPVEPVTTRIDESEYYPPLVYETYMTPQITKLHISENTEDAGTTVGSGDSQYNIMGNFLLMGKGASDITTYCTNTLGAMTKRNYRPYSVSKMGNLCFEIGDPIRLSNDRMSVESYMLTRTFTGLQGFTDDISAEGTQDYTTTANTASSSVQQLNSKTLKLKQDVDGLSSRLTYELDGTQQGSYAYQTAEEIGLKVSDSNLLNSLDSKISSVSITANGFNFQSTGSIVINTSNFTLDAQGNATFSGTVSGANIYCGTSQNYTTYISADGQEARFANGSTVFRHFSDGSNSTELNNGIIRSYYTANYGSTILIGSSSTGYPIDDFEMYQIKHMKMYAHLAGGTVFDYSEVETTSGSGIYTGQLSLGSDKGGGGQLGRVAINGSTWVHVGVSSPSIHIGNSDSTNDLRIQASSSSNITFKYGNTSKTLASILSDISSASSTASSASSTASSASTAASSAYTLALDLSSDVETLEHQMTGVLEWIRQHS